MLSALGFALALGLSAPDSRSSLTDDQLALIEDRLTKGGSFKVRLQAALILGEGGRLEAEPPLREASHGDANAQVRAAAALALAELGGAEVAGALVEALGDENPFVREEAEKGLARLAERLGPPFAQPFGAALGGAPEQARAAGVPVFALLGPAGAEQLAALVGDDAPTVRTAVAAALARLPPQVAGEALRYALRAGSFTTRAAAAAALAERRDALALPDLAALASSPTELPEVQQAARRALAALSDLIDPGVERRRLAEASAPDDRVRALVLLVVREGPGAEDACERALGDISPIVQAEAVEALGRLGDPRALPALRRMLDREEDASLHGVLVAAVHAIERSSRSATH